MRHENEKRTMIDENSSLDDDVTGMLDRIAKQHHAFKDTLPTLTAEGISSLALVEIAHQLAYANTLKGLELLIHLEDDGEHDNEDDDEDEDDDDDE